MSCCSICTDSFTAALRKRTDCSYCNVPVCRTCLQTCLLMDNAAEPVCPSCRAVWTREFLNDNLTAAFRNGPFKKYREKVLVDRERARLPETQEQAAAYKKAVDLLKPIDEKIAVLRAQATQAPARKAYDAAYKAYTAMRFRAGDAKLPPDTPEFKRTSDALKAANDAYTKEFRAKKKQIKALNKDTRTHRTTRSTFGIIFVPLTAAQRNAIAQNVRDGGPAAVVEEKKKAVFIQKCPAATCEGFLSTQWKCGLCDLKVCKDCHEPKTATDDAVGHICDPEVVESIKAIRKEAKPCPKCAAQISKIDGCDQMWCTQCKTAFSWNTGTIETHIIHNPHYFQWMRANGGMPRAPGDAPQVNPCEVRGALDRQLVAIANAHPRLNSTVEEVRQFLRLFLQIEHEDIHIYRGIIRSNEHDEWRRRLRVQRMVNEITEDQWKSTLQRKEKETYKARDKLQLLEMYSTAGKDIIGQVLTDVGIREIHTQLRALCEFSDKAAKKMADVYTCAPMKLDPRDHGDIRRQYYM